MKFQQLYSSSGGNLYVVTANNGKRLLIECGIPWKRLQKALNFDLSNIAGCLLSHEHKDHSKSIIDVMRAGIDVYASIGTLEACGVVKDTYRAHSLFVKEKFSPIVIGSTFSVICFNAFHDAKEPLLFAIKCDDQWMLFATDTSHIQQKFVTPFSIIAIECSFEKSIVERRLYADETELKAEGLTRINETLAKRLLDSHMEKQHTIDYLEKHCDLSKCHEIHLLHLSGENIDKQQTREDVEEKFFIRTVIV